MRTWRKNRKIKEELARRDVRFGEEIGRMSRRTNLLKGGSTFHCRKSILGRLVFSLPIFSLGEKIVLKINYCQYLGDALTPL